MMPNEYVANALRTESRIEKLNTHEQAIRALLEIIIGAGNMLDQYKKNAFYGKPFDTAKFDKHRDNIADALYFFRHIESLKHPTAYKAPMELDPRLFHGVIGIITEAAELAEGLNKVIVEKVSPDTINMLEEVGDLAWYEAILVDSQNGDLEAVLDRNIAKLKARFPNKFTAEDALNRDLVKERAILEGK